MHMCYFFYLYCSDSRISFAWIHRRGVPLLYPESLAGYLGAPDGQQDRGGRFPGPDLGLHSLAVRGRYVQQPW